MEVEYGSYLQAEISQNNNYCQIVTILLFAEVCIEFVRNVTTLNAAGRVGSKHGVEYDWLYLFSTESIATSQYSVCVYLITFIGLAHPGGIPKNNLI